MRPGDPILLRGVFRGKVRWATPHRLVELTDERVAMFLEIGTLGIRPSNYDTMPYAEALLAGWEHVEGPWHSHHVLRITPIDAAHSVDLYWNAAWEFAFWYVNLQERLRRTTLGFDTWDQQLDIVVEPDRTWRWKDAEEFLDLEDSGILTSQQTAEIRAEGRRVIDDIEAWGPPFNEGWEEWRPNSAWTRAELPGNWDVA